MRKRRRMKTWRFSESWLGRWFERHFCIRERYCSQCNQPYLTAPEAKPESQFFSCSSAALVYPYRRGNTVKYRIRLGRWEPRGRQLQLAQIFDAEDLEDLVNAILQAQRHVEVKMSAANTKRREQLRVARG